jgi:hypothetical protein
MCDFDLPSVYHEKMVKARKAHYCYECRKQISKGEVYEYISGVWDSQWSNYKICASCSDLNRKISKNSDDGCGAPFGQVLLYAKEEGLV